LAGSFLDTTIVIATAEKSPIAISIAAEKHIAANPPAETPYYALRELLAGHLHLLCDTHNAILAAANPAEAIVALLRRSPAEGRKREARIAALALSLAKAFGENPSGGRDELKRETLQDLSLRINQIWRRAHRLKNVSLVQSLGCFNRGSLTFGPSGELRGPKDSFNCISEERCAAAAYLFDNKSLLHKLITALHPKNLTPEVAAKNENRQRRKALKELAEKGPNEFHKGRCRALGDAYFAAMCPPGSDVLSTNIQDHLPLCVALGKRAIEP